MKRLGWIGQITFDSAGSVLYRPRFRDWWVSLGRRPVRVSALSFTISRSAGLGVLKEDWVWEAE